MYVEQCAVVGTISSFLKNLKLYVDEIFFAVSGSEDVALELKSRVQSYL